MRFLDIEANSTASEGENDKAPFSGSGSDSDDDDDLDNVQPRKKRRIFSEPVKVKKELPEKVPADIKMEAGLSKRQFEHRDRLEMSDDDEDAYKTFRQKQDRENKLLEKGKENKRGRGRPRTTEVTKRKLPAGMKKDAGGKVVEDVFLQLPEYLQSRKAKLGPQEESERDVKDLYVPPDFSEIHFPEDDDLEDLEERPAFTHIPKSREYEDLYFDTTLGVIPAPIAQYLRDYQVEGARMMHYAFIHQKGMILGDDMGLGKTVQVISFLTAAFGKTGDARDGKRMREWRRRYGLDKWYPRVLIVCPLGVMDNWQREFDTWGWWQTGAYHGKNKESVFRSALTGRLEVMLTTYETCRTGMDIINRVPWDCVICDECHRIKEITSNTTKAMQSINALCRIGLTGTAIQNNYEELWTLLNWCNPGFMGPLAVWKSTVSAPLKLGQSHNASPRELGNARRIAKKLRDNLLPRFFLRRTKNIIKDQLTNKRDRVLFCPLTKTQEEVYLRYLASDTVKLIRDSGDPCDCNSGKTKGSCCYTTNEFGEEWKSLVFPSITTVLQLANHLANWIPTKEEPMEEREKKFRKLQICLPDKYQMLLDRTPLENYMDTELCGKWLVLRELLRFWYNEQDNTKVLIFSLSLKHLNILSKLLANTSYSHVILTGEQTQEERTAALDRFTNDPTIFIFLISTRAGGVGLNMTAANKVVIFDPNWNPSHDLQAQDRAFRFGQRRDVDVFRLISAGTVEEIVYARQIYKQQMANIGYGASAERRYFEGIQDDKKRKGELFGLKNIFAYRNDVVLKDILHKTNIAEARAGFKITDIDVDDTEEDGELAEKDPDKLISQLAGDENIEKPKAHPVQAILDQAGVLYAHENAEVIGTSHVEDLISKAAEKLPANGSQTDEAVVRELLSERPIFDTASTDAYKFRPPRAVMERQFRTMARWLGYEDLQDFALVVESWSQKQRTDKLDAFYRMRRRHLEEKNTSPPVRMEPTSAHDSVKSKDAVIKVEEVEELALSKADSKSLDLKGSSASPSLQTTQTQQTFSAGDAFEKTQSGLTLSHLPRTETQTQAESFPTEGSNAALYEPKYPPPSPNHHDPAESDAEDDDDEL